jgi:hypothetical protein
MALLVHEHGEAEGKALHPPRREPELVYQQVENQMSLIYKEIQIGAVAKSYMTYGLLIYGEIIAHFLIY